MKIAFIGKQRSGKSTCTDYLIARYNGKRYSFASRLYEMQAKLYEMAELPYPPGTKNRGLLQYLGTDFVRAINPDQWVNILEKQIKNDITLENIKQENYLFHDYKSGNMYVDDCRFPNECRMLKDLGFLIVKIIRPEEDRVAAGATNLEHISETALDDYMPDAMIINNTSLEKLYERVEELINRNNS